MAWVTIYPDCCNHPRPEDILRWLHLDIAPSVVRDYIYERSIYPGTIPVTKEDHAITHAISRQVLHLAMQQAKRNFPPEARLLRKDLLPLFEPILAGGGALSDAPTPGQSLLLLLDALQPVGITSIILDPNNLLPLLGAAAKSNHLLPVQVREIRRVHEPGHDRIGHQFSYIQYACFTSAPYLSRRQ